MHCPGFRRQMAVDQHLQGLEMDRGIERIDARTQSSLGRRAPREARGARAAAAVRQLAATRILRRWQAATFERLIIVSSTGVGGCARCGPRTGKPF